MRSRSLPGTIADVTPEWLAGVLADAPEWNERRIVSVAASPVGGRDALASAVYRADVGVVQRDGTARSIPLLVKLHAPAVSQRNDDEYAAEVWFYRELASRAGVPVPATYVAEFAERLRHMVIVQEFLTDGRIGSSDVALDVADLQRVLGSLAALHATWWKAESLARMPGVRTFDAAIQRAIVNLNAGALDVPRFLDRFGQLIHPATIAAYRSMPGWMARVAEDFSDSFTLIHLDCSAKNIFIPDDQSRMPVLFDWALVRSGNPGLDLATLLCYSMAAADHLRIPELLRYYLGELEARGVRHDGYATLWTDFRLGCLWRMAAPVANAMSGTIARDDHVRTIIPQLDAIVLSCGALELVE